MKTDSWPDRFYGGFLEESAICGHMEEAGLEWHTGGLDMGTTFPILNKNWRIEGDVDPNAQDYLAVASEPFSVENAQRVVTAGNKLVEKYDDVRIAARQIQEIHMRSIAPLAQNARDLLKKHPERGEEIAQLHELGAMPHYSGEAPVGNRTSGFPYDDAKTTLMVKKLRKDVQKGRVLVVHVEAVKPNTAVMATPTTTAVKKLPDRTVSTDVRIISDLRLPNLYCDKNSYPPVYLADISEIAERAVMLKRTWPNIDVVCCKRDIDAAFKRVRTHPDMCVMLCTEFRGEHFALDGNIYFMYLALPFGWRGSPAYFPCIGHGVALAHRNFSPANKIRDGHQDLSSLLFVDDAIFIEPRIGMRPEVCVSCWESIWRRLLGADSPNEDKLMEEGDWKSTHILLGYEVNVNSLTIRLPEAKVCGAWGILHDSVFKEGNRIIPVKNAQVLR